MPEMRTDLLVILVVVCKPKMVCHGEGRCPEKVTHFEEGIPGTLITAIRIGLEQRLPTRVGPGSVWKYFPFFPGLIVEIRLRADMPDQDLHQHVPHIMVHHMLGVGDLLPPEPLGNIGGDPPELVAAVGKGLGSRGGGQVIAFIRWREGRDDARPYPAGAG